MGVSKIFFAGSPAKVASFIALSFSLSVFAQNQPEASSQSRERLPSPPPADHSILTDPKLRAEEGSMSALSLKFNLSYSGPTLGDLSAKEQPNPDGSVGSYSTSLGGSVSARYRVSPTRAFSVGTGIKAIYPLHGLERFDMNNPYINYDLSSRWGRLQMRNSPGISYITIPNYKIIGEYAALNFDNSIVYDFPESSMAIGLDTNFGYYLYDRPYEARDKRASTYTLSLIPNLKYRVNDRLNLNTSIGFNLWNPRSEKDHGILWNRVATQRIGLGFAWTKEIYMAPYLGFFPDRLSADTTTFNMSTIFSLL